MKSIRVLENFEVRRQDSLNWRVWQYKRIESGGREGEHDWMALDSYHPTVAGAVEAVYRMAPREEARSGDVDLKGAVEEMRSIERDISKHAREFAKAAKSIDA